MKWALKIIAKLLLARIPVSYDLWRSLGLFRHGRMDSAGYMYKIFKLHVERAYPKGLPPQSVILELGPGDSIGSSLIAAGVGAAHTYLVDVGCYAQRNVCVYQTFADEMRSMGINVPNISSVTDFEDVLRTCRAEYLTSGLDSLKGIPSESIDFIWSHSVLEHVRKSEVGATLNELKRILRPGGYASHNIDFQDHLDGSLNNLRFSEKLWESELFSSSGFYTNRITATHMHGMFSDAGFKTLKEEFGRWPVLPLSKEALHKDFRSLHSDELITRTSHVLLQA